MKRARSPDTTPHSVDITGLGLDVFRLYAAYLDPATLFVLGHVSRAFREQNAALMRERYLVGRPVLCTSIKDAQAQFCPEFFAHQLAQQGTVAQCEWATRTYLGCFGARPRSYERDGTSVYAFPSGTLYNFGLALRSGNLDVAKWMKRAFRDALEMPPHSNNALQDEYLARLSYESGSTNVVTWVANAFPILSRNFHAELKGIVAAGNVDLLKQWDGYYKHVMNNVHLMEATRHGHLDLVQHILRGMPGMVISYEGVLSAAVTSGNIPLLSNLHEQWRVRCRSGTALWMHALDTLNPAVLQWLRDKDFSPTNNGEPRERLLWRVRLTSRDDIKTVAWINKHYYNDITLLADDHGLARSLESCLRPDAMAIVDWFHSRGVLMTAVVVETAVAHHTSAVVQHIISLGADVISKALTCIATPQHTFQAYKRTADEKTELQMLLARAMDKREKGC